jgi:hypothetical protein
MPNLLVPQGSLNRLRASVVFDSFPELNITSSYLGREGIRFAIEGNATDYLQTMTGAVTSPVPYMLCTLTINLIKSQPLANLYKRQFEDNTLVGHATVRPDAATIEPFAINNVALEGIGPMSYAGEDPVFVITAKGYILVNAGFFNSN